MTCSSVAAQAEWQAFEYLIIFVTASVSLTSDTTDIVVTP